MRISPTRRLFTRLFTFSSAGIARRSANFRRLRHGLPQRLGNESLERRAMLALTVDVPSAVLDGINGVEFANVSPGNDLLVAEVTAGQSEIVIATFTGPTGATIDKPLVGNGLAQRIELSSVDFQRLGEGDIRLSVRNYTVSESTVAGPIRFDRTAPAAPVLNLGQGVSNGASLSEATQPTGIVTVRGEAGAEIIIDFRGAGGSVLKFLTGTGSAQPVTLTATDLTTLGDGSIDVSATQTDRVGNPQIADPAQLSFELDATPPGIPTLSIDPDVAIGGITRLEAAGEFVTISAQNPGGSSPRVNVTFTPAQNPSRSITKWLDFGGNPSLSETVSLTDAEFDRLGEGVVTVAVSLSDEAGNVASSAPLEFELVAGPARPLIEPSAGQTINAATATQGFATVSGQAGNLLTVTITGPAGPDSKDLTQQKTLSDDDLSINVSFAEIPVDGSYTISAVQSDWENDSPVSAQSFTLDTVADAPILPTSTDEPKVGLEDALNGTTVKVRGEAGATILVTFSNQVGLPGRQSVTRTVTGQGLDISVAVPLTASDLEILTDGLIDVVAKQTDRVDNESPVSAAWTFELDRSEPAPVQLVLNDAAGSPLGAGPLTITAADAQSDGFIKVTGGEVGNTVVVIVQTQNWSGTSSNPRGSKATVNLVLEPKTVSNLDDALFWQLDGDTIARIGESSVILKVRQWNERNVGSQEVTQTFSIAGAPGSLSIVIDELILPATPTLGGGTLAELGASNIVVQSTEGWDVEAVFRPANADATAIEMSFTSNETDFISLTPAEVDKLVGSNVFREGYVTLFARQKQGGSTVWSNWEEKTFRIDTSAPDRAPTVTSLPTVVSGTLSLDVLKGDLLRFTPPSGLSQDPSSLWNGLELTLIGAKGSVLDRRHVVGSGGTQQTFSLQDTFNPVTGESAPFTDAELKALGDGELTIYARSVDAAGNVQPNYINPTAITFTIDVTAPSAPVLAYVSGVSETTPLFALEAKENLVTVTGNPTEGAITLTYESSNGTVSLTATRGGTSPSVTWTVPKLTDDQLKTLGVGEVTVTATQVDAVGNESLASAPLKFTIVAPDAPRFRYADGIPSDGKVTVAQVIAGAISIQGTDGLTLEITFKNAVSDERITHALTAANGNRQPLTLTAAQIKDLVVGRYDVEAVQIDSAGNRSDVAKTALDIQLPAAPTLRYATGVSATDAASIQEMINGAVTVQGEATLSIEVTFENTVTGGKVPKTIPASGNPQSVTFSPTEVATLGEGTIEVTAIQTDAVGQKSAEEKKTFTLDATAPGLLITRGKTTALKIGEPDVITFTFTEPPVGFTLTDIDSPNGQVSNLQPNPAAPGTTVYTADFVPNLGFAGPNATVTVAAARFTDAAGNPNAVSTLSIPVDAVAPTLAITGLGPIKKGDTATITFTLSEASSDFDFADVQFTYAGGVTGQASGLFGPSVDGKTYTATFTPVDNVAGSATIRVNAGAFTDLAGNPNTTIASHTILVDTIAPTVTITRAGTGTLKAADTTVITFTLSEPSTTFAQGDVGITNGTLSGFSGSGLNYTATFTPAANFEGMATITVPAGGFTDAAGNPNTAAAPLSIVVDTKAPTLTITRAGAGTLKAADTTVITFTLSEPSTTFAQGDVGITNGTLSGFSGSGLNYTATFTPAANFEGMATITVPAGVFTDAAGNPNVAATPLNIAVDTIVPTLTITRAGAGTLKAGDTTVITFTLSEPSTTFAQGDVGITNGTLSGFSGSGLNYTATFTPAANFEGMATITVPAGGFTDAAGNPNTAAAPLSIVVDTKAPTLSITRAGSGTLRADQTETIYFTLSEPANSNFGRDDVIVSVGGKLDNFTQNSGTTFSATFTPNPGFSGDVTITVGNTSFTDVIGNPNFPGASLSIPVKTIAPTLTITRLGSSALKAGDNTEITFTLSEASGNFTQGDVRFTNGQISEFKLVSSAIYTATFTPAANFEGMATITVPVGVFTDTAGNPNVAALLSIPVDTVAPAVPVLALGSGVANGATLAEATQSTGVLLVRAEVGSVVQILLEGTAGNLSPIDLPILKAQEPLVLTPEQVLQLGQGPVAVRTVARDAAGNASAPASTQFTIDTVAPAVPVLALGAGAANGATLAEATQEGGVVTVIGEIGSTIIVEFDSTGGPIRKIVTGTGHPVPVTLTAADVQRLGDRPVLVSARQTDPAGNEQTAPPATITFRLDTTAAFIMAFRSDSPNGVYGFGQKIVIEAVLSEAVRQSASVVVGLNTGGSATLTATANQLILRGTYEVQPNDMATALEVVSIGTFLLTDLAGNPAPSLALPLPGSNLASFVTLAIDGRIKVLGSPDFGTSPGASPTRTTPVTVVPLNFNTSISGLTLDSISLLFNGREISLRDAAISGSGTSYTLRIPANLTNLRGTYELLINPQSLTADVNGSSLSTPLSLYWTKIA